MAAALVAPTTASAAVAPGVAAHAQLVVVSPGKGGFAVPHDPICQDTGTVAGRQTEVTVRGGGFPADVIVRIRVPAAGALVASVETGRHGRFQKTFVDPHQSATQTATVVARVKGRTLGASATYDSGYESCFEVPSKHSVDWDGEGWSRDGTVTFSVGPNVEDRVKAGGEGGFSTSFSLTCVHRTKDAAVISGLIGTTEEQITTSYTPCG